MLRRSTMQQKPLSDAASRGMASAARRGYSLTLQPDTELMSAAGHEKEAGNNNGSYCQPCRHRPPSPFSRSAYA